MWKHSDFTASATTTAATARIFFVRGDRRPLTLSKHFLGLLFYSISHPLSHSQSLYALTPPSLYLFSLFLLLSQRETHSPSKSLFLSHYLLLHSLTLCLAHSLIHKQPLSLSLFISLSLYSSISVSNTFFSLFYCLSFFVYVTFTLFTLSHLLKLSKCVTVSISHAYSIIHKLLNSLSLSYTQSPSDIRSHTHSPSISHLSLSFFVTLSTLIFCIMLFLSWYFS